MSNQDAASSLQETANSLDLNEVPNKLKCAICSKLALNAFKLPCCAQSICESCQSTLQGSCPVCEHSPLSPELCVPHKALRNTIKAYLKTAEKKLAEEQGKAQKAYAPVPECVPAATPDVQPSATPDIKREESVALPEIPSVVEPQSVEPSADRVSIAPDDPQPSIEFPQNEQQKDINGVSQTEGAAGGEDQFVEPSKTNGNTPSRTTSLAPETNKGIDQMPQNNMGFGMNGNGMPNMMNMGLGGNMDLNPMMQFMPNGMMNGMANMTNMMGMPSMGMDPMSQGMFGAFGQGMGMNQMSGMNMGFDPSGGQGMFGAWNNQNNMWNGPQSNPANGFGNNMGYGYNMNHPGNFQQNQYPYNDFQHGHRGRGFMRGRGRGRGAYGWRGHGGYGSSMQGNHPEYQQQAYQQQQQQAYIPSVQGVTNDEPQNGQVEAVPMTAEEQMKQIDDSFAPGGEDEVNEALGVDAVDADKDDGVPAPDENVDIAPTQAVNESRSPNHNQAGDEMDQGADTTQSIPVLSSEPDPTPDVGMNDSVAAPPTQPRAAAMPPPTAPLGPAAQFGRGQAGFGMRGRGYGRFPTRGRGGFGLPNGPPPNAPTAPKGQGVVGAPMGPKALRKDVQPPTGPRSVNEGLQIMGRASMAPQSQAKSSVETDQIYQDDYRERTPSRSRSQSRSESHDRSHRNRHHREFREASDAEHEARTRRTHKRRSSKYDDETDYNVNGKDEEYSREPTPDSSRKESRRHKEKERHSRHKHRSSHKSRHDYDEDTAELHDEGHESNYDKRAKTAKDSGVEGGSRSSSHRGHRDRDRDRHHSSKHESSRREDRHRDRKRSRRDYDEEEDDEYAKESRHRSRRPKHEDAEDVNGDDRSMPPPTPVEPEKDPHTLEREARNRERMLKEQQRREAANADRSSKSRRDSRQERSHGGRRVSYKYEDEANAARVEREREAARWT